MNCSIQFLIPRSGILVINFLAWLLHWSSSLDNVILFFWKFCGIFALFNNVIRSILSVKAVIRTQSVKRLLETGQILSSRRRKNHEFRHWPFLIGKRKTSGRNIYQKNCFFMLFLFIRQMSILSPTSITSLGVYRDAHQSLTLKFW